jgi:hypothetical protein
MFPGGGLCAFGLFIGSNLPWPFHRSRSPRHHFFEFFGGRSSAAAGKLLRNRKTGEDRGLRIAMKLLKEEFRVDGTPRATLSRRQLVSAEQRLESGGVCSSRVEESQSVGPEDSVDRQDPGRT